MPRYEVSLQRTQYETEEVEADSPQEAAAEAVKRWYGEFVATSVDDRDVLHKCEGCGVHILDGDDYVTDCEGVALCFKCVPSQERS